jgi:phosphoglycolate phosphatase-like HAD superfamily hydrolase
MAKVAIFDLDGTLVDNNYQHALAWFRAFRRHGVVLPVWRVHRHIGMGGDKIVAALAGEAVERARGDALRQAHADLFASMLDEVEPLPSATALLQSVKERGARIALATSAKPDQVEHLVDLLDARKLVDAWTTSEDVETTKPAPDLIAVALQRLGLDPTVNAGMDAGTDTGTGTVMVGDSVWDCHAAGRLGIPTLALRSGGYGADELTEAGAARVFESPADLVEHLDETPLA